MNGSFFFRVKRLKKNPKVISIFGVFFFSLSLFLGLENYFWAFIFLYLFRWVEIKLFNTQVTSEPKTIAVNMWWGGAGFAAVGVGHGLGTG